MVYDDIGCMMTLPGDYFKALRGFGIDATPFSALKGNADSEFNNRSHRVWPFCSPFLLFPLLFPFFPL